ncbi:MAG TPA: dephospho-CoA kinase [Oceanospirillales bacterium]|nr:dephospho-CoA kinase [Oceanospirillales bacterium]
MVKDTNFNCYTIGLTGGIASGKSAVSEMFAQLACTVIDADVVAREVVEPGTDGLNQLVVQFGVSILNKDQRLDRKKLRKLVFNDKDKLASINAILHPLIQKSIFVKVRQVKAGVCIIVIPLLCEGNRYQWLDRVLVVDVKPEVQLQRLMQRDTITQALADKMLNSQCSRQQRLAIADDVIRNEETLQQLNSRVKMLYRMYKSQIQIQKKCEA